MRRELEILAHIDEYLDGNITKQTLKQNLKDVTDLDNQIAQQASIRQAIKKESFLAQSKSSLEKLKMMTLVKTILVTLAILIGATTATFLVLKNSNKETELTSPTFETITPIAEADLLLNPEYFEIDNSADTIIITKSGTILNIKENSFEVKDNKNIKVTVKETITPAQIIKGGLSTFSDYTLLETGGMFKVSAFQGNKELSLKKDSTIDFMVPTISKIPGMKLYTSEIKQNGEINWVNPRKLNNPLTPINIKDLRIYPELFIQHLIAKGTNNKSKTWKDSTYFDVAKLTEEERSLIGKDTTFFYKFKEGINPGMLKSFYNENFNNTLLATLEFQKRLNLIHETGKDEILKLYTNNLDKNMFEIDSMAKEVSPLRYKNAFDVLIKLGEQKTPNIKSKRELSKLSKAIKKSRRAQKGLDSSSNLSYYHGKLIKNDISRWCNIDVPFAERKARIAEEEARYQRLLKALKKPTNTSGIALESMEGIKTKVEIEVRNARDFSDKNCFAYLLRKDAHSFEKIPVKNNKVSIKYRNPKDYELAIVGLKEDRNWLCIPNMNKDKSVNLKLETKDDFETKIATIASAKRFNDGLINNLNKHIDYPQSNIKAEISPRLALAILIYKEAIDTILNKRDLLAYERNKFTVQTLDYDPNKQKAKYIPTSYSQEINFIKAFLNSDKYDISPKNEANFSVEIINANGKNIIDKLFKPTFNYSWPKNILINCPLQNDKKLSKGTYIVRLLYFNSELSKRSFTVK